MNTARTQIIARGLRFSIIVGSVLVLINQSNRLINGAYDLDLLIRVVLTYLTPFAVSVFSSLLSSRASSATQLATQNALEASVRFPTMNPNPVLRVARSNGELRFCNQAAQPVCESLNLSEEKPLTQTHLDTFAQSAQTHTPLELECAGRTYELLIVSIKGYDFYNAYGTDVTAQRALTRFPAMNPNPVLRVNRSDGSLHFNNQAAQNVCKGLGLGAETPLTRSQLKSFKDAADTETPVEVEHLGRTFELGIIDVEGFNFFNAYGTDVTAQRALTRFPAMNPNPVLRVFREDGAWLFNNDAALSVCHGLALTPTTPLTPEWLAAFRQSAHSGEPVIVDYQDRSYKLKIVDVEGFGFLNAYGRDVTAERMVTRLNQENLRLLSNILPAPIITRLQKGEELIVDKIPEMSVLFADLVGFTKMSTELTPQALLTILNEIFSTFDNLAERYGLEKIKTIGDAYMVVGGLSGAKDHLSRIVKLGFEMNRGIEAYNQIHVDGPLSLRIGVHVGEGVAGVIGIKKFIYDVWGDTVNTASRMESTGIPGRIQVTQNVVAKVGEAFRFSSRGKIQVKGKGLMETFLLDPDETSHN
jgi:class 3 adenylate cyclase